MIGPNLISNYSSELIIRYLIPDSCFLDKNNILWRIVDNKWIGKKAEQHSDLSWKWIEGSKIFKRLI